MGSPQPRITWATSTDDTFIAPYSGEYLVGAWGGGGNGSNNQSGSAAASGGSGGLAVRRVFLLAGQTITAKPGGSLSVTFPDASTMTATSGTSASGATPGAGGTASGGEINLPGVAGSAPGAEGKVGTGDVPVPGGKAADGYAGGASAPTSWPFVGGRGGKGEVLSERVEVTAAGAIPGGGGAACKGSLSNIGGRPQIRIFGF
ncbi:hypothetical protein [Aureimonas sp. Leaf324]|uniref:hypothetical protein n=1 Tax=Aureimonas sp. Leaf324 TaxID=1736336 RepID=UPI0006F6ABAF|nr:hypothetical protein [Aureimonas sp. Leaf324]KQQ85078.1 hypothetical protein ASF65_19880 [Aureimonas sp. Leaf324]